jgi:hypothetical protein
VIQVRWLISGVMGFPDISWLKMRRRYILGAMLGLLAKYTHKGVNGHRISLGLLGSVVTIQYD